MDYLFTVVVDYNKKLDYERPAKEWKKMKRVSADDWDKNVEAMVEWSPFSSEAGLLRQVIYLLFFTAWFITLYTCICVCGCVFIIYVFLFYSLII